MNIRYAISDIHGNAYAFLKLLDHVDPDPEELVICGDICNYGIDVWGVFEECAQLIDEGATIITGNHDDAYSRVMDGAMNINSFMSEPWHGLVTMKSFELAADRHGKEKVQRIKEKVLNSMVAYLETDDYIFTHAGLDPRIPYMHRQPLTAMIDGCKEWKDPNLQHSFDQTVVYGHTPTWWIHREIKENDATVWYSRQRKKLALDTGAAFGCRLTMVDLVENTAYAYDFEKKQILEYQFRGRKKGDDYY